MRLTYHDLINPQCENLPTDHFMANDCHRLRSYQKSITSRLLMTTHRKCGKLVIFAGWDQ